MSMQLRIRRTYTYVGTYSHLDLWDVLDCRAECIGFQDVPLAEVEEDDLCEPQCKQIWFLVTAPGENALPSDADLQKALEDEHTSQGCAHEWDCCGCRSYSAEAEQLFKSEDRQLWKVVQSSSRNY